MSNPPILSRRQLLRNLGILTLGSSLMPLGTLVSLAAGPSANGQTTGSPLSTFSIVAYDPDLQAWGVAVTSKFLAVGAIVPYAGINEDEVTDEGRVIGGAIANQAFPDPNAARIGFQMLLEGASAQAALEAILAATTELENRQFGVVDAQGATAVHTGSANPDWSGHIEGDGFTTQGNILAGPEVLEAVADSYTASDEDFWLRLLNALKSGEEAGGDRRVVGRDAIANSAAIRIVAYNRSILGETTNFMDLRVDDDPDPIEKLDALMQLWLSNVRPVPTTP